jgi:hypothetical protein
VLPIVPRRENREELHFMQASCRYVADKIFLVGGQGVEHQQHGLREVAILFHSFILLGWAKQEVQLSKSGTRNRQ